jgi:hypothetical protein
VSISFGDQMAGARGVRRSGVSSLLGLGLIVMVIASCSSAAKPPTRPPSYIEVTLAPDSAVPTWAGFTPMPLPTDTEVPTPTLVPTPTPIPKPTDSDIEAVCASKPALGTAKYAGSLHPLVVAEYNGDIWTVESGSSYPINDKWYGSEWTSPLQLVVCVGALNSKKISSCGKYTSTSGQTGYVYRYQYYRNIRVALATTGKTLQTKTILGGGAPLCRDILSVPAGTSPPWKIYGDEPDDGSFNAYATAVSVQKAK